MPDEAFGSLISFRDVEVAILEHNRNLIDAWLAARERRVGLPPGQIARPRSYIIKQTFTALPGQERTPMVVVVSDGFEKEPHRRGDGRYDAYMRIGVAAVVYGPDEDKARDLAGHYQSALVGIALKHRSPGPNISLDDITDMGIDDIDEEASGRSMSAIRLDLCYKVINFTDDASTPKLPTADPYQPLPSDPVVLTHYETVNLVDSIGG
jgi:hypothetical protein